MNRNRIHLLLAAGFGIALGVAPATRAASHPAVAQITVSASDGNAEGDVDHVIRRVVELDGDDGAEHQQIEVHVVDDDVRVRLNGEEIPVDRVRREDGRIVILDAQGNEIDNVHIGIGAGPGRMRELWIGENAPLGGTVIDIEEFEEPKVMLGIHLEEPGPALERHLHLEPGTTTLVTGLYKGLPAEQAGLGEFDIITSIDGRKPAPPAALRETLAGKNPGDGIRLSIIHEGSPHEVVVTLAAFDREAMDKAELIGGPRRMNVMFRGVPGNVTDGLKLKWFDDKELRGLLEDGVFLDGEHRIFMPMRPHEGAGTGDIGEDGQIDDRLGTLDERLREMEQMLNELLEKAMKDR